MIVRARAAADLGRDVAAATSHMRNMRTLILMASGLLLSSQALSAQPVTAGPALDRSLSSEIGTAADSRTPFVLARNGSIAEVMGGQNYGIQARGKPGIYGDGYVGNYAEPYAEPFDPRRSGDRGQMREQRRRGAYEGH